LSVDNAVLRQKIAVRIAVRNEFFNRFGSLRVPLAVDFFAGEGTIAQAFWSQVAQRVECVDMDGEKLRSIQKPNIATHCGDNTRLLHLADDAQVIDCDAYGLVLPFIKLLLARKARSQTLIFFTDGTPKVQKKRGGLQEFDAQIESLGASEFHFEKSHQSNVLYGWLWFE